MKAERPKVGKDKKASYLLVTDDAGEVHVVELSMPGSGHSITKDRRELRSQLLDKLAAAINAAPRPAKVPPPGVSFCKYCQALAAYCACDQLN